MPAHPPPLSSPLCAPLAVYPVGTALSGPVNRVEASGGGPGEMLTGGRHQFHPGHPRWPMRHNAVTGNKRLTSLFPPFNL